MLGYLRSAIHSHDNANGIWKDAPQTTGDNCGSLRDIDLLQDGPACGTDTDEHLAVLTDEIGIEWY